MGAALPEVLGDVHHRSEQAQTHLSMIRARDLLVRMRGMAVQQARSICKAFGVRLTVLVQCGWAAVRVKDCRLRAQFLRIKSRRGPKKAIVAVAASILTAIYCMLRDGVAYRDLGGDYFERRDMAKTLSRLVKRIEGLGYHVTIEPAA